MSDMLYLQTGFLEGRNKLKNIYCEIQLLVLAVARVLRAKFAMGLFEQPYRGVAPSDLSRHMHTPEAVKLARQLDADSIVLLENRNNVLPLRKNANIAIIGPMADVMNVSLTATYTLIRDSSL